MRNPVPVPYKEVVAAKKPRRSINDRMKELYMSFEHHTITDSEKTKIKKFIDESLRIFQEVEDLKGGLSDLGKVLAEELGIKPAQLNSAARAAYKSSLEDAKENIDVIEELLIAAGRA